MIINNKIIRIFNHFLKDLMKIQKDFLIILRKIIKVKNHEIMDFKHKNKNKNE